MPQLTFRGKTFGPVNQTNSFTQLSRFANKPANNVTLSAADAAALGLGTCPACAKFFSCVGPRPALLNHLNNVARCKQVGCYAHVRGLQAAAPPGSSAALAAAALGTIAGAHDARSAAAAAVAA